MITFKSVKVKNFLSFGEKETTFPLNDKGTTLILGHNIDASGDNVSRNGSGKSSSIQAILFALYGKGLDKLKADEYVNITNGKKLEVTLEFDKGGVEYKIVRRRKPSGLDLYINGESSTLDSMANTDNLIQDIIGMSHEVFLTSFFLTPHNDSFMAMFGVDQRALIESMLSLDTLVKRAESLKLIKKDLEVDLKLLERDLQAYTTQNNATEANLERLQGLFSSWETNHKGKIENLSHELTEAQRVDVDSLRKEWEEKQRNDAEKKKIETSISDITNKMNDLRVRLVETTSEIKAIESKIASIEEASELVDSWDNEQQQRIDALTQQIEKCSIDEPEEALVSHMTLLDGIERDSVLEKTLDKLESQIESKTTEAEKKEAVLESLRAGKCHECGQSHFDEEKASSLESEINILVEEIEALVNQCEDIDAEKELLPTMSMSDYNTVLRRLQKDVDQLVSLRTSLKTAKNDVNPHRHKLDSVGDIEGLRQKRSNLVSEADSLKAEGIALKNQKESLEASLEAYSDIEYPLLHEFGIEAASEIEGMANLVSEIQEDLEAVRKEVNPYADEIEVAKGSLVDVSEVEGQIEDITKDITHCQYLVKLLTDNKSFVRKNIVDRFIPMVNKKIVEYTELLGLLHVPSINSDLTTDIVYLNKSVSYYNLSQGERLRTNLAVSLAFRHLMKSLGNDTNLLVIDEFFDSGGDAIFLQKAFFLTQGIADSVLMVSHREEFKEIVDRTVTIVKENGFSRVE